MPSISVFNKKSKTKLIFAPKTKKKKFFCGGTLENHDHILLWLTAIQNFKENQHMTQKIMNLKMQ